MGVLQKVRPFTMEQNPNIWTHELEKEPDDAREGAAIVGPPAASCQ